MKKFILILIASIGISFYLSAQSAGDYSSVGSGNWNDPTKWILFDGANWVGATTYPGQNPGTGNVTIINETEIKITETVPHPVNSLSIGGGDPEIPTAFLTFSAEAAVSLTVSGDVIIEGELRVDNQNGTKTHDLFIGRNFIVFLRFNPIDQDDKLGVTFNTTDPNSSIQCPPQNAILFHDITFNGTDIGVYTNIIITGNASFINGIVKPWYKSITNGMDLIHSYEIIFDDGATVSGGSNASFIDGTPSKVMGADPFTFPIGDEGFYAPLTISVAQPELIYAMYSRNSSWPLSISDPELFSVSNCEYWHVFRDELNSVNNSIDVTVNWTSALRCDSYYIPNVSDIVLAYFDGYSWSSHGGTGIGTTTNGSITWSGSNFGPLTLGNVGTSCEIPSGLSISNVTSNSATLSWAAVNGAISYDVDYKQYSSNEWTNAATATTATSVNLSDLSSSSTYNWRVRTNCSLSSSSYREDQFATSCGVPSSLSTIIITDSYAILSWSPIPNVNSYNVQYKQSSATTWITFSGVSWPTPTLTGLSASTSYDWRVSANCYSNQGDYVQASFTTSPPPCNDVYETNNTSNQAKTIAIGNTISASITSTNDIDWFKVTTPNNSNTNLQVTLSSVPADYDLYVYNKSLKLVGSSVNAGTVNEVVTYNSNSRKATYYIKVVGKIGAHNTSQCFNLRAQVSSSARSVSNASIPQKEINEELSKQILYPNPASEFVYLNFNSATEGLVNIQIVNSIGQLVKQHPVNTINGHNQIKINVVDIRPGMYILRINKAALNITRKFVIAR